MVTGLQASNASRALGGAAGFTRSSTVELSACSRKLYDKQTGLSRKGVLVFPVQESKPVEIFLGEKAKKKVVHAKDPKKVEMGRRLAKIRAEQRANARAAADMASVAASLGFTNVRFVDAGSRKGPITLEEVP